MYIFSTSPNTNHKFIPTTAPAIASTNLAVIQLGRLMSSTKDTYKPEPKPPPIAPPIKPATTPTITLLIFFSIRPLVAPIKSPAIDQEKECDIEYAIVCAEK